MEKQIFYHSKTAKNLRFLKPISTKFTKLPNEPSGPSYQVNQVNSGARKMGVLDGLKITAAKKPIHLPSAIIRRNKLSNKLWEQIQLAKSQIDGTQFVVKKYRSFTDKETGLRKQIEMPKRIREWWFKNELGKVCFCVKYGSRPLEIAKGKHSVEVGNPAELVKALELVKSAVEAGELDAQIELASGAVRKGFGR